MRAAVSHHGQEPAAGVLVLRMLLKMEGELIDFLREHGYLHLRRARIRSVDAVFAYDSSLFLLRKHCGNSSRKGLFWQSQAPRVALGGIILCDVPVPTLVGIRAWSV